MNFKFGLIGAVLIGSAAIAGCTDTVGGTPLNAYSSIRDGQFRLPAIPKTKLKSKWKRRVVSYQTKYKPGTIVINTSEKYLYLVQPGGKALRYGVGVGKEGFLWKGKARIGWKREWPTWTPPATMIRRKPELRKWAGGMPPGLQNPLGARALYLNIGGRPSIYRLHGSPEWWSIGTRASSGCIRLMNHDVIDLYERVGAGTRVIVI